MLLRNMNYSIFWIIKKVKQKDVGKPIEAYKNVGKVTYADKDDVKHHDLAKIEKNINQHRANMNKNNKK